MEVYLPSLAFVFYEKQEAKEDYGRKRSTKETMKVENNDFLKFMQMRSEYCWEATDQIVL